jgi:hypothetical protein
VTRKKPQTEHWTAEVHRGTEKVETLPFDFPSVQRARDACERIWEQERLKHGPEASDRLNWMLHGENLWIATVGEVSYKVYMRSAAELFVERKRYEAAQKRDAESKP